MTIAKKTKGKVLIGLSGGVDSAVACHLLLQAGYQVEGVFLKNWSNTTGLRLAECPWLYDRREALRVAAFFGIPLRTLDLEKDYQAKVMRIFFREYQAGRTPNPDILCNTEIKFGKLLAYAKQQGFDFLATGHYARIARRPGISNFQFPISKQIPNSKSKSTKQNSVYTLERSDDRFKDQTYFLYGIKKTALPRLLFPLGQYKKTEVRQMAQKLRLPNASRKESMGICFVGKVRLKAFLGQKLISRPGPIVLEPEIGSDSAPRLLGRHQGLYHYTIGQRQGIGLGSGGPYFVTGKDLKKNLLYVTTNPHHQALQKKAVQLTRVNWLLSKEALQRYLSKPLQARCRHQGELVPCRVTSWKGTTCNISFDKPQAALATGQSLVLYAGNLVLGGGVIND